MRILRNIFVPYLEGGKLKSEDPEIQRLYSRAQIVITTYESNKLKFPIESIQTLPISLFGDSESQGDYGKKAEKKRELGENTLENSGNREAQSIPKFKTFISCAKSLGVQIKISDITRDTPSHSRELPYHIVYVRQPHAQTWCICDQVNYSIRVYDGIIDIPILANEFSSSSVSSTEHAREIVNWNGTDEHIRANITRVLRDGISHNEALRNHDIKTLEGARNILEESALILAEIRMMYLGDGKWDLSTMLCGLKSIGNKIGLGKTLRYFPNAGLNKARGVGNPKRGTLDHVGHIRDMLVSIGYQSGDIIVPKRYIKIT